MSTSDDFEARMRLLIREEFAKLQNALLVQMRSGVAVPQSEGKEHGSVLKQVLRYFDVTMNKPSTISDISASTGISRGSINNVLYRTNKDKFEFRHGDGGKKLWTLANYTKEYVPQDMADLPAHKCCKMILIENHNKPMHALSLAREAIRRGYRGRSKLEGDALEWLVAKSFWARLSRDHTTDFVQEPHMFFRIRPVDVSVSDPKLFDHYEDDDGMPIEEQIRRWEEHMEK